VLARLTCLLAPHYTEVFKKAYQNSTAQQLPHAATPIRANSNELLSKSIQPRDQSRSGHKNRERIIASRLASFWQQRTLKVQIYQNASRDYLAGL